MGNPQTKGEQQRYIQSNFVKTQGEKIANDPYTSKKPKNKRMSCQDVISIKNQGNDLISDLDKFKLDGGISSKNHQNQSSTNVIKQYTGEKSSTKNLPSMSYTSVNKAKNKFNTIKEIPFVLTEQQNEHGSGKYESKKYQEQAKHAEVEQKRSKNDKVSNKSLTNETTEKVSNKRSIQVAKESTNEVMSISTINDLNNFNLIKVIGKGTFGKVVLVSLKEDSKVLFAMKILKKEHLVNTKNVKNIIAERKLLGEIDSNFIVKLRFTFQSKEKLFMAFDYHNGGELFFHLQKKKRFSEEEVRIYAAEIYLALFYLHNKNIIYRDIKPENIILDKLGHLKLVDFGLAKKLPNVEGGTTKSFCGTNEYIPPEVLLGNEYSFNFDWWGFGVILYELLHGVPPFTGNSKRDIFKKIIKSDPHFSSSLSKECVDLLKKLMNKNPLKRISPIDIPAHPFFQNLDFNKVEALKIIAPISPKVKDDSDYSNIDPIFLNEQIQSPYLGARQYIENSLFKDF